MHPGPALQSRPASTQGGHFGWQFWPCVVAGAPPLPSHTSGPSLQGSAGRCSPADSAPTVTKHGALQREARAMQLGLAGRAAGLASGEAGVASPPPAPAVSSSQGLGKPMLLLLLGDQASTDLLLALAGRVGGGDGGSRASSSPVPSSRPSPMPALRVEHSMTPLHRGRKCGQWFESAEWGGCLGCRAWGGVGMQWHSQQSCRGCLAVSTAGSILHPSALQWELKTAWNCR